MRILIVASFFVFSGIYATHLLRPAFNGSNPGCGGGGCHNMQDGTMTAVPAGGLDVQVEVTGVSSGQDIGGELVSSTGTVVDVVESTTTNPFTLTAPSEGTYRVNAGYKEPSLAWDSTEVILVTSDIEQDIGTKVPNKFVLEQNHPNPFNPETLIRFSLAESSELSLTIYNMRGQIVRTLASGIYQTGSYSLKWDGTNNYNRIVPSGIYLYSLRTKAGTFTKRMMLLK